MHLRKATTMRFPLLRGCFVLAPLLTLRIFWHQITAWTANHPLRQGFVTSILMIFPFNE